MSSAASSLCVRGISTSCALLLAGAALARAETAIPRSTPGDKGRYFLIETRKTGDVVDALHKRIAPDGEVGFTRTQTNCRTMKMRQIGYGEGGAEKIKVAPTKWFDLVAGSSKSDLALFVCRR